MPDPLGLGKTYVEISGKVYGARADALGPIGGSQGYQRMVAKGDYEVTTLDQLLAALQKAQKGQVVYVSPKSEIDVTERVYTDLETIPIDPAGNWLWSSQAILVIPAGVTLASNRGEHGAEGAMIFSDAFQTRPMILAQGPGVRITGLRLRGPDPKPRLEHHARAFGDTKRGHPYYYKFPVSNGVSTEHSELEVDNCEMSGWSHAAIFLKSGDKHRIHHNFIHHCQFNGLGYGVCLDKAFCLIETNLFNFNRHSIAGTGNKGSGYEARNNVEQGASLSHCFDMHGGSDRGDGTNIAGDWLKVHHNTFRASQQALVIRGLPQQRAEVHGNWFCHGAAGSAVSHHGNTAVGDNACGLANPKVDGPVVPTDKR